MARVIVPVDQITRAGVASQGGAASEVTGDTVNNHYMENTGRELVQVRNADASPHNITLVIAKTVDGESPTNKSVSVPANGAVLIGPFPEDVYDQRSGDEKGFMHLDVDDVNLMLMAFKLN